jgi:hypothetical protein
MPADLHKSPEANAFDRDCASRAGVYLTFKQEISLDKSEMYTY